MSFRLAEKAIEDRIRAAWPGLDSESTLLFANTDAKIPALPYLHVMVIGEREEAVAFGGGRGQNEWDIEGRIEVRVFVPILSGRANARRLRDLFATVFRGQRFQSVSCWGVSPIGEGQTQTDRGNSYYIAAAVDFTYRFRG